MDANVLVLEDDPDLADVLTDELRQEGCRVVCRDRGVEAVRAAAEQAFDLALLDVEVPDLSGLGVERAVRDVGSAAVVVMSARLEDHRREALAAGAVACLKKPFERRALMELLRAVRSSQLEVPPWHGDVRELSPDDLRRASELSDAQLDALPFGVIRLDFDGRITAYNAFEAHAAGYEPSKVVGMPFAELAPCVMVKDFLDATRRGREARRLDEVLRFVFPHHGAACVVSVRLYFDRMGDQLWLFVSKVGRTEAARRARAPRPAS